jgi:hypothetical protein
MRKKYNEQNDNIINNYFLQLILAKYIIPSLFLLVIVFGCILLGFRVVPLLFADYIFADFLFMIFTNILVSIASVSIYHTIKTCVFGFNQLAKKQYTVLQLTCIHKYKKGLALKCVLSDKKTYRIYDGDSYNRIEPGKPCDLIIITNEYGAKLWEIILETKK